MSRVPLLRVDVGSFNIIYVHATKLVDRFVTTILLFNSFLMQYVSWSHDSSSPDCAVYSYANPSSTRRPLSSLDLNCVRTSFCVYTTLHNDRSSILLMRIRCGSSERPDVNAMRQSGPFHTARS